MTALFAGLAATAALLVPISVTIGGLGRGERARLSVAVGVLAGLVQVLGLLRWVYEVPVLAAEPVGEAAVTTFRALHAYLGVGVGEALGYLGTAAWTVLVVTGPLRQRGLLRLLGVAAAAAVAVGVAEPFGLAAAGTVNFAGYLAWSVWLAVTGASLARRPATASGPAVTPPGPVRVAAG
ncbi:hypothetical protein ACFQY4_33865 [Catellatospora bangladeshensis]|uniref:hypothetical protein n=1 Tax=Catellatospora bangladeshensis TaxID=310355 RepID=UPI003621EAA9